MYYNKKRINVNEEKDKLVVMLFLY